MTLLSKLHGRTATLFAVIALASAMMAISPSALSQISGKAQVIDGDTLKVGRDLIGLFGIDAPENKQSCLRKEKRWPCRRLAREALRDRIGENKVECFGAERDRHDRLLAVCLSGGEELNKWLVEQGWAIAYRPMSTSYASEEAIAVAARRGIWHSNFIKPWEWRRGKRIKKSEAEPVPCEIKGKKNRDAGKVYYLPNTQQYPLVKINPDKGDRWLCTEKDALSDGWKPFGGG